MVEFQHRVHWCSSYFFSHLIQFFSIRSRYKGRPIYTSRYQEAGGSSVPTSSGSRETLRSTSQLASSGSAPSEARPSPSSASYTAPATQSSQGLGLNISSFLLTTSNQWYKSCIALYLQVCEKAYFWNILLPHLLSNSICWCLFSIFKFKIL